MERKHDGIIVTVTDYSDGTQDMEIKEEERCCGNCCFMCYEDTDGWGQCVKQDIADSAHCSDLCTNDKYVSREEMRHHLAVLLLHKRWFHAQTGLMPIDFDELNEATKFAVDYIKTFSKL